MCTPEKSELATQSAAALIANARTRRIDKGMTRGAYRESQREPRYWRNGLRPAGPPPAPRERRRRCALRRAVGRRRSGRRRRTLARPFSREFRRAFGESPHAYLLTRRLERAAALRRATDRTVANICLSVGLHSVGSFTTSFTRTYGMSPTAYRAQAPPASQLAQIPTCVLSVFGRPQHRTFREDSRRGRP